MPKASQPHPGRRRPGHRDRRRRRQRDRRVRHCRRGPRAMGGPTILVNNAAASVAGAAPWSGITADQWDAVLRTNVTGAFLCARAVHPFMQARGRGRIITMGSVRSPLGRPGNVHYTASKSAHRGHGARAGTRDGSGRDHSEHDHRRSDPHCRRGGVRGSDGTRPHAPRAPVGQAPRRAQ